MIYKSDCFQYNILNKGCDDYCFDYCSFVYETADNNKILAVKCFTFLKLGNTVWVTQSNICP